MESSTNNWKQKQLIKLDEHDRPYIEICEGYTIGVEYEELTEKYKQKAEDELRETPDNVKKGLEELINLLNNDEQLYVPVEHEEFLIKFLRPTKYYAKSAYDLMRRYYKFKQKYSKYCDNLLPCTGKKAFEHSNIQLHPRRTQDGSRIFIIRVGMQWNPSQVSLGELFRAVQLSLEAAILEPMTQVNGNVTIIDVDGLSFKQIMQFTPSFAHMLLEWTQECMPIRLKAVHIVNNTTLFEVLFNIFKPFIATKQRNRIFVHGKNYESLLNHIDPDRLRPCYGGTMPCDEVDGVLLAEIFETCTDEFELANTFGFVDSKSKEKPVIVPVTTGKGAKYVLQKNESEKLNPK